MSVLPRAAASRLIFLVLASLSLVLNSPALADSCPDELLTAQQKSGRHGLWVHDLTPGAGWKPLDITYPLSSASIDKFAFVGRSTGKRSGYEGALSVKFLSEKFKGNSSAEKILLRRTSAEASCGYRKYFLWALTHLDFLIGVNVSLKDYIQFHATDSDNDGYIQRFHADYRDEKGDCTSSSSGEKRSGFLIDHEGTPIRSSDAVVAAIKNFFATSTVASEKTSTKSIHIPVPSVVKSQLTKFEQYSEAETQVHTYSLDGGPICVSFSERYRSDATVIEIVDLDAPKSSSYRRRVVTVRWH